MLRELGNAALVTSPTMMYAGYTATSVDPGWPLMVWTLSTLLVLVGIVLPLSVVIAKRRQASLAPAALGDGSSAPAGGSFELNDLGKKVALRKSSSVLIAEAEDTPQSTTKASCWTIMRMDQESIRILNYTIPFTLSALADALFNSACLAIVGHYVGTAQVTAFAEVSVLYWLTEEFLRGPLHANPTACAAAIGSCNNFLAGQYVQLSVCLYFIIGMPFFIFWYTYMYDLILWLDWGDNEVAYHAQSFVRILMFSHMIDAVAEGFVHLLDVTDCEIFTTFIYFFHGAIDVITLLVIVHGTNTELTLPLCGWVFVATSAFTLVFMLFICWCRRFLHPFKNGLFTQLALVNRQAVSNMIKISLPLAIGSILGNAEWAILGVFAAHLGRYEVAAWALIGYVWEVFDALTYGVGDAAEIQVALHIGENHPDLARMAAYKSLAIGMTMASLICAGFIAIMPQIPSFFTNDVILQEIIAGVLPYMALGYPVMTFGYLCWYIVGATGRYRMGTLIHFSASWGVTLPLGALFVYRYNFNIQALVAAIIVGYALVSTCLAFVVFTTNWNNRAYKAQQRNIADDIIEDVHDLDRPTSSFVSYASLRSRRAKSLARKNLVLLQVAPGPLGLTLASPAKTAKGTIILRINYHSPLFGRVMPGDRILAIDGFKVGNAPAPMVARVFDGNEHYERRFITILTPRKRFRERTLLKCDTVLACSDSAIGEQLANIESGSKVKYHRFV